MLIREIYAPEEQQYFSWAGENWTGLKKDQLVRVGCDTCKIPEKCETVFGSGFSSVSTLIDKHLTQPEEECIKLQIFFLQNLSLKLKAYVAGNLGGYVIHIKFILPNDHQFQTEILFARPKILIKSWFQSKYKLFNKNLKTWIHIWKVSVLEKFFSTLP